MMVATRDSINLAKACVRAIVSESRIRMEADHTSPDFDIARKIQLKYGEYLFESLTNKTESELDEIIRITTPLIRRLRDPKDNLRGIV